MRRNKNDDYTVKDIWICIKKLKHRENQKRDIKYELSMCKLCKEI